MAYKKPLPARRCDCGKPATYQVLNQQNADLGNYCSKCAERLLARLAWHDAGSAVPLEERR